MVILTAIGWAMSKIQINDGQKFKPIVTRINIFCEIYIKKKKTLFGIV